MGMVGEYLANQLVDLEETLFSEVRRLPPAHYLIVNHNGLRKKRLWDIDPEQTIRYRNPRAYVDHFRELFANAVRQQLRSIGPVGCDLSGGLDSSSVVAMAAEVGQALGQDHPPPVFSHVFPGMTCDETQYIDALTQSLGLSGVRQDGRNPNWEPLREEVARTWEFPDFPITPMYGPLYQQARDQQVRVILTGVGGDEWFFGCLTVYADLLRRFRWRTLWRRLRDDPKVSGVVLPKHPFRECVLWPLTPPWLQSAYRTLRTGSSHPQLPDWLLPEFCSEIHLADRLNRSPKHPAFSSLAKRELYLGISSAWQVQGNESSDRFRARIPIEQRHPLHDRRLIEFAFAVPETMHWREGTPKWLLRQAMREYLPPLISNRLSKADFT